MNKMISTREAYGEELCEQGRNKGIYVFDADLSICTMTYMFAKAYPERFFNAGIAEANMVGMAAGAASTGKIAFCNSFAMFIAGRCYDQVRNSVAYPNLNVKMVGTHAGLSVGEDGATHQCIEDISIMRTIPGMTVICPCDANETKAAVKAIIKYEGPCYLRLGRGSVENITNKSKAYKFYIGKAVTLKEGNDITIIATGIMVQKSMDAAKSLESNGIMARVIDMHTIKPIDREAIIKAAKETGMIVTVEEHNVIGGLGAAVAEVVTETVPVPVIKIGIEDVFGHSGKAEEVLEKYGLTIEKIIKKAKEALTLKV